MFKLLLLIPFLFYNSVLIANNNISSDVDMSKVTVDGRYYDWIVYYIEEIGSEKKCYIASFAKETKGNYKVERKPYIMIARFATREIEQVSVDSGFIYKKNSFIYLDIDNKQTRMITKDNKAWNKTEDEDRVMIYRLINANKDIKVRSETIDGKYTIDTYSTNGLARAYKRMKDLCK